MSPRIRPSKLRHGFTLAELLVSMAILGLLLAGLITLFSSNSRLVSQQFGSADAETAVRLALQRMTEIVSQAQYIYPAGTVLTIQSAGMPNRSITTGANALAVLVPAGTTFCTINTAQYCGFVFSIEPRNRFQNVLPSQTHSQSALVEWRSNGITWAQNVVPANSLRTWSGSTWGILADSVLPAGTNGSNLASVQVLTMSEITSKFDDRASPAFSIAPTAAGQSTGLITAVTPSLAVRFSSNPIRDIERGNHILVRAIPRSALPLPN